MRADAFGDELLALGIPRPTWHLSASPMAPIRRRRCRLRTSVRWCCVAGERPARTRPEPTPPSPPTRSCGPDISRQLTIVLRYRARLRRSVVPEWKRELACDDLVTDALRPSWAGTSSICPAAHRRSRTGRCGVPIINTEDPAGCGNTVEVDGACHLAGTVNYSMYGIARPGCAATATARCCRSGWILDSW